MRTLQASLLRFEQTHAEARAQLAQKHEANRQKRQLLRTDLTAATSSELLEQSRADTKAMRRLRASQRNERVALTQQLKNLSRRRDELKQQQRCDDQVTNQNHGEIGRTVVGLVLAVVVAADIAGGIDLQIGAEQLALPALGTAHHEAAFHTGQDGIAHGRYIGLPGRCSKAPSAPSPSGLPAPRYAPARPSRHRPGGSPPRTCRAPSPGHDSCRGASHIEPC